MFIMSSYYYIKLKDFRLINRRKKIENIDYYNNILMTNFYVELNCLRIIMTYLALISQVIRFMKRSYLRLLEIYSV